MVNEKNLTDLLNAINNNKHNNNGLFLVALLFAVALSVNWLIITFAILLLLGILIDINRRVHFIRVGVKNQDDK